MTDGARVTEGQQGDGEDLILRSQLEEGSMSNMHSGIVNVM